LFFADADDFAIAASRKMIKKYNKNMELSGLS